MQTETTKNTTPNATPSTATPLTKETIKTNASIDATRQIKPSEYACLTSGVDCS